MVAARRLEPCTTGSGNNGNDHSSKLFPRCRAWGEVFHSYTVCATEAFRQLLEAYTFLRRSLRRGLQERGGSWKPFPVSQVRTGFCLTVGIFYPGSLGSYLMGKIHDSKPHRLRHEGRWITFDPGAARHLRAHKGFLLALPCTSTLA